MLFLSRQQSKLSLCCTQGLLHCLVGPRVCARTVMPSRSNRRRLEGWHPARNAPVDGSGWSSLQVLPASQVLTPATPPGDEPQSPFDNAPLKGLSPPQTTPAPPATSNQTLIPAAIPGDPDEVPPEYFNCPITLHVMWDPVAVQSGVVYERIAIERYFQTGGDGMWDPHCTCE